MTTLEITTSLGCPLACTFCPQDTLIENAKQSGIKRGRMSLEEFKSILQIIPQHVRVDFSGFSEPFSNPDFTNFLKHVSLRPNNVALYTTLQGATTIDNSVINYLTSKGQLVIFTVHLPDDHNNMPGFRLNDEYIDVLVGALLNPLSTAMTMSKSANIHSGVLNLLRSHPKWPDIQHKLPKSVFIAGRRAGSLNTDKLNEGDLHEPQQWKCTISCSSTPFYDRNVVIPGGNVYLCCMDYGLKHPLGNIHDGYYKLFESNELGKVISSNLDLDSNYSICKTCENVTCHSLNTSHMWAKT